MTGRLLDETHRSMKTKRARRMSMEKSEKGEKSEKQEKPPKPAPAEPEADISILQPPMQTSVTGISKLMKIYVEAAPEVQMCLANECDLMYECRVCRSVFRSISHFLMHKKSFCKQNYILYSNNEENGVHVTQVPTEELKMPMETVQQQKPSKKSLISVVDAIAQKKHFGFEVSNFSVGDFYREMNISSPLDNVPKRVDLISIPGTSAGVYQTVTDEGSVSRIEHIQHEVQDLEEKMQGQTVLLKPDGKVMTLKKVENRLCNHEYYACAECDIDFCTKKTYNVHMYRNHKNSTLMYSCTDCPRSFTSVWGVYRHMLNVHKQTISQVKMLRDQIVSSAHVGNIPHTSEEEIKAEPISEQELLDDENQAWMDNFETDNDIQKCGGCGRKFERKAALHSHSQTCQKRIQVRNQITVNRQKRANEDKNETRRAKHPKMDNGDAEKRDKPKAVRKNKTGIQIRYDYIKEKNASSTPPDEYSPGDAKKAEEKKKENFSEEPKTKAETDDISEKVPAKYGSDEEDALAEERECTEKCYTSDAVCEIIGVQRTRREPLNTIVHLPEEIIEAEVVSIKSSDSSPEKEEQDPLSVKDVPYGTDSEIEDILGSNPLTELFDREKTNRPETVCSVSDDPSERYKVTEINENTLKLIKLMSGDGPEPKFRTLDEHMKDFVNMKRLLCKPCGSRFSNLSKLRSHMSLHFNWNRFRCDICPYKSFDKVFVYGHIRDDHNIQGMRKIEAVLMPIAEWETVEHSSKEFLPLKKANESQYLTPDKEVDTSPKTYSERAKMAKKDRKTLNIKRKVEEVGKAAEVKDEPVEVLSGEDGDMEPSSGTSHKSDTPDIEVRKMVYSVIFGEDNPDNKITPASEKPAKMQADMSDVSSTLTRPVRNRVKPINKDFIYDMNEIEKRTRSMFNTTNVRHVIQSKSPDSSSKPKVVKKSQSKNEETETYKNAKPFGLAAADAATVKSELFTIKPEPVSVTSKSDGNGRSADEPNTKPDDDDVYIIEDSMLFSIGH